MKNFKMLDLKFKKGVTLIEIIVVISIISIFVGIIIADFPRIRLQLSLSRVAHIVLQDIKTAQNLSNSGTRISIAGELVSPKGYGIFFDSASLGNKKYIIYADVDGDKQYIQSKDFIYKEIDLNQNEPGIIINAIHNGTSRLSINFTPPNFDTTITNLLEGKNFVEIEIAIESIPETTRIISVNKSGFVEAN